MREAIDLYLATAPAGVVFAYAVLGIIGFGGSLWGAGNLADHVTAYRTGR